MNEHLQISIVAIGMFGCRLLVLLKKAYTHSVFLKYMYICICLRIYLKYVFAFYI